MNNIATIYNIVNPENNKSYIGSTIHFEIRKNAHLNTLNKKKHPNPYLQRAFNLLKNKSLQFNKLATCPKEYQFKLEQWFLDNTLPSYNISRNVSEIRRKKLTQEIKKRMSESAKLRYINNPKEKIDRSITASIYLRERWKDPIFAKKMKIMNSGENHPQAKITTDIVKLIKKDIQNNIPGKFIIDKYNISSYIYKDIKRNKTWKNIIV